MYVLYLSYYHSTRVYTTFSLVHRSDSTFVSCETEIPRHRLKFLKRLFVNQAVMRVPSKLDFHFKLLFYSVLYSKTRITQKSERHFKWLSFSLKLSRAKFSTSFKVVKNFSFSLTTWMYKKWLVPVVFNSFRVNSRENWISKHPRS